MNPQKTSRWNKQKDFKQTHYEKQQAPILKFNCPGLGHENGSPKLLVVHELVHTYIWDLFALLPGVSMCNMCMCVICVSRISTPQTSGWNWMTFLETIHQALNSVAFYIVAFEICAQSISQFCCYIHGCLENFKCLGFTPNKLVLLLFPLSWSFPPWLEQATLLEKHLPVAKLHSTPGNLVLDSWELDLQKSLGVSASVVGNYVGGKVKLAHLGSVWLIWYVYVVPCI